ncbi:MAG: hypothetical protein NW202_13300 [Nitrospira sp.]|nr:hypothetical protein [Nitrospira sp.]
MESILKAPRPAREGVRMLLLSERVRILKKYDEFKSAGCTDQAAYIKHGAEVLARLADMVLPEAEANGSTCGQPVTRKGE